jgi:hypothetical protein
VTFALTISDGAAESSDVVNIIVENVNHAPTAAAGASQTKNEGVLVRLDGSRSSDPDGDPLSYHWRQVAGPALVISDSSNVTLTLVAPQIGPAGKSLVFELIVNDGFVDSVPSIVTITVVNADQAPACTLAMPSPTILWPPNHKLVTVAITGLDDESSDDHGDDHDHNGRIRNTSHTTHTITIVHT